MNTIWTLHAGEHESAWSPFAECLVLVCEQDVHNGGRVLRGLAPYCMWCYHLLELDILLDITLPRSLL